jgi:hypothetical protein
VADLNFILQESQKQKKKKKKRKKEKAQPLLSLIGSEARKQLTKMATVLLLNGTNYRVVCGGEGRSAVSV